MMRSTKRHAPEQRPRDSVRHSSKAREMWNYPTQSVPTSDGRTRLFLQDKGPVTSEKGDGGFMGRTDDSQKKSRSRRARLKRFKLDFDKESMGRVTNWAKCKLRAAPYLPLWKSFQPSRPSQERSLTERQKHRSQDAPRLLPLFLKGQQPRGHGARLAHCTSVIL